MRLAMQSLPPSSIPLHGSTSPTIDRRAASCSTSRGETGKLRPLIGASTMRKVHVVAVIALLMAACAPTTRGSETPPAPPALQSAAPVASAPKAESEKPEMPNPLLAEWTGPYGGVPPFSKAKVADMKPAFDGAMARKRREIAAITDSAAAPTFENTIAA